MRTLILSVAVLMVSRIVASAEHVDSLPSPEALDIIRAADAVYVFPSLSPTEYRRNDGRARLLGPEARRRLVALLGDDRNWHHGLITFGDFPKQPVNVGFIFRRGKDELVLFFSEVVIYGTFRGRRLVGDLQREAEPKMEHWKERYAGPELRTK